MKYSIIDLEWIKQPKTNTVQIGGIMFNEDDEETSRFYRVVRPSCEYDPKDISFMPVAPAKINAGIPMETAMKQFISWLNGCYEILVWGKETKLLLHSLLKRHEGISYHKIVALQDEFMPVNGERSFKETCKRLGIKIDAPLHNSINDCEYLFSVYKILRETPPWADDKTEIRYDDNDEDTAEDCLSRCTYITLQGSKIYHRKSCYHVSNKNNSRKVMLFNITHPYIIGCEPCKNCMDKKEQAKRTKIVYYTKRVKWDYDVLEHYCDSLGIKCNIYSDWVYIYTGLSTWFFRRDVPEITLFHENYIKHNTKKNKWGQDYHKQNKQFYDPLEAVYYIYCHDKAGYKAWV